ncbi:MAG: glycoside hydrolase/phage tail family protein [Pseudomonadota bacterium]
MATILLSAAGSSIGSAAGGTLLGIGASSLGKAAGAIAGSLIDQQILGQGAQTVETGRVDRLRIQGAGEGAPIAKLYGRMRVGGQLIWSSRFKEHVDESRAGGKGTGGKVRSFSYTISMAVALCEGKINRIGRVWADGNEISLSDYTYRLYRGGPLQPVDPLIEDIEEEAPAFRDVAYVVFEDFPLGEFGNRIPQLNIEVYREPAVPSGVGERSPALSKLVKGVALSPGSGEFALDTQKVRRVIGPGRTAYENVNTLADRPDIMLGLDQLQTEAPDCEAVSLIVSWFGDDLRCGRCDIQPCVESDDKETDPSNWQVSGTGRGGARRIGLDPEGRPVYGGTPSDGSVIRSIQEMNGRGLKVMFYPFILMDIQADNAKVDPWTGGSGQPAFPWRGRITLDRAPGVAGSADKTGVAADEVGAFFGAAARTDFAPSGDTVSYSGPSEWSFRRFILHYAHLCAQAGGVDSFCIGSEMRSLTQIRSGAATYPSVDQLMALAADVKAILGPGTKIGYAADWSEYFGHQPGDGTGDAFFHLDPLWASDDIDFVGIDNYLPLSDWHHRDEHADSGAGSVYSLDYLTGNVEGGEGYDWFYSSAAARAAQDRTPITDGAFGEDWIYRPKDLRQWWQNLHHNRPGGVREATPTAWVPGSKPIWFTEVGCPAVDLGANQPNVFVDPKSSETALPYFSRGIRDDYMQRRYLQSMLGYWADDARNPVSASYGGRMVDTDRAFVWTWDARPWPDYPNRNSIWSDGPNHRLGHWITGRLGSADLANVVAEICEESGIGRYDVSELFGVVHGYMREQERTGRAALQPLMMAYAFDVVESGGVLKFRHRDRPPDVAIDENDIVLGETGGVELELTRGSEGDLPRTVRVGFVDSERDYETGALEAASKGNTSTRIETTEVPIVLDGGAALTIAERYVAEARSSRETAQITLGRRLLGLEPGDIVGFSDKPPSVRYRIESIEDGASRSATLTKVEAGTYVAAPRDVRAAEPAPITPAAPVAGVFMDLPLINGDEAGPSMAAFSVPWTGEASLFVADTDADFELAARLSRPAVSGVLLADLGAALPHRWTRGQVLDVKLFNGGLSARPDLGVLNGANRAAIRSPSGEWEVLQFQSAELIGVDVWRLSRLLRGQAGTEPYIGDPTPEGAEFVLLNNAIVTVDVPGGLRGVERNWRIGPSRKPYSHEAYEGFLATDNAARLRPYAPIGLKALRDHSSGDLRVSWIRRTRSDGDSWMAADPPLAEAREAYRIRVVGARSSEVGEASWVYSAADQLADGVSGLTEIAVAQISDQFGLGPETKVTVYV